MDKAMDNMMDVSILHQKAQTIRTLMEAQFDLVSIVQAVTTGDLSLLKPRGGGK